MAGTDAQADWIQRVLGFTMPVAGAAANAATDTRVIWRDAKEEVDSNLNRLASELRSFGDPELERIADFGVFGVTAGETVALAAALMDYEGMPAGTRRDGAAKVRAAVTAYRKAVAGNPIVALLDDAPFSVKVGLRATMFGALREIESSLDRAA